MRIFVTGAGGFIGSAICSHLQSEGHTVQCHVRSRDGNIGVDSVPQQTDLVVNSAGRLGSPSVDLHELTLCNSTLPDILGTLCVERGIPLVHISTPGVSGLVARAVESLPPAPWGPYEKTKAEGEALLRKRFEMSGSSLTILRPDFVYGPGDMHKLELFRQVARGIMPLIGWRGALLRPTFVEDVCTAVSESLPDGCLHGGLFNIGGPEIISFRELTSLIAGALGRRLLHLPVPRFIWELVLISGPLRPSSITRSRVSLFGDDHYVSIDKASGAGFRPCWTVRDGVETTVTSYISEGLLG